MRKLGPNQLGALRSLAEHNKGVWYDGCGWYWDTLSGTVRLLDSLIPYGHVVRDEIPPTNQVGRSRVTYTITDSGREISLTDFQRRQREAKLKAQEDKISY